MLFPPREATPMTALLESSAGLSLSPSQIDSPSSNSFGATSFPSGSVYGPTLRMGMSVLCWRVTGDSVDVVTPQPTAVIVSPDVGRGERRSAAIFALGTERDWLRPIRARSWLQR